LAILLGGLDDLVPSDRIVRHFRLHSEKMFGPQIQHLKSNLINTRRNNAQYIIDQQNACGGDYDEDGNDGIKGQNSIYDSTVENYNDYYEYTHTHYHMYPWNNHNSVTAAENQASQCELCRDNDKNDKKCSKCSHISTLHKRLKLETSDIHLNNVFAARPREEHRIQGDLLSSLEHGLVHRYNPDQTYQLSVNNTNRNATFGNNQADQYVLNDINRSNAHINDQTGQNSTNITPTRPVPLQIPQSKSNSNNINNGYIGNNNNNHGPGYYSDQQSTGVDLSRYYNTDIRPEMTLKSTIRTRILFNPNGSHASFLVEDKSHIYDMFAWLAEP
jgi:hypothetical protein